MWVVKQAEHLPALAHLQSWQIDSPASLEDNSLIQNMSSGSRLDPSSVLGRLPIWQVTCTTEVEFYSMRDVQLWLACSETYQLSFAEWLAFADTS